MRAWLTGVRDPIQVLPSMSPSSWSWIAARPRCRAPRRLGEDEVGAFLRPRVDGGCCAGLRPLHATLAHVRVVASAIAPSISSTLNSCACARRAADSIRQGSLGTSLPSWRRSAVQNRRVRVTMPMRRSGSPASVADVLASMRCCPLDFVEAHSISRRGLPAPTSPMPTPRRVHHHFAVVEHAGAVAAAVGERAFSSGSRRAAPRSRALPGGGSTARAAGDVQLPDGAGSRNAVTSPHPGRTLRSARRGSAVATTRAYWPGLHSTMPMPRCPRAAGPSCGDRAMKLVMSRCCSDGDGVLVTPAHVSSLVRAAAKLDRKAVGGSCDHAAHHGERTSSSRARGAHARHEMRRT